MAKDEDFKPDLNAIRLKNRPVIPDFSDSPESAGAAEVIDLHDVLIDDRDEKYITPTR